MDTGSIIGLVVGIIGVCFGIWGTIVSVKQTFTSHYLQNTLESVRGGKVREVWVKIGIDLTAFDALDEARKIACQRSSVDHEVLRKIESARRATIDIYRMLLAEAASLESHYNLETIKKWEKVGKLENEWRVSAAMSLLPSEEIIDYEKSATKSTSKQKSKSA